MTNTTSERSKNTNGVPEDQGALFDQTGSGLLPHQGGDRLPAPDRDRGPAPMHAAAHETEHVAAAAIRPKAGTWRAAVLEAIADCDPAGLTQRDLELLHPDARPQTIRTRCSELVKDGWVEDSGRRRVIDSGLEAIVWVLTERGREQLA